MLGLSEVRTRALLKEMAPEGRIAASGGTKKKVYFKQKEPYDDLNIVIKYKCTYMEGAFHGSF